MLGKTAYNKRLEVLKCSNEMQVSTKQVSNKKEPKRWAETRAFQILNKIILVFQPEQAHTTPCLRCQYSPHVRLPFSILLPQRRCTKMLYFTFETSRISLCTGFAEVLSQVQQLIPGIKTELESDAVYTGFHHVIAYLPLQCHHQTATKSHGSSQW